MVIGTAFRGGHVHRSDVRLAVPALLVGAYCGARWRMVTAGGIGANIGGALVVRFAPFFALGMIVWFGLELRRFRDSTPSTRP